MEKIKVIMIDDNVNLIGMVKEYFSESNLVEIVNEAYDGLEGIKLIEEEYNNFDILILDLIMPRKDGMYVLEEMAKRNLKKSTIVATSYNTQETIRDVAELGAKYFILKPFELDVLEKKILELSNKKLASRNIDFMSSNLQISLTKLLHELGIPSHIKGYQYVRDGISLLYNKPEFIGGITKELYPELAKRYQTTVSRVERAIRHAIEISWNRGDIKTMEEIFGHSVDVDKTKPTNSEFIATIADKLRIEFSEEA